jgi:hypothetical protein
MTTKKLILALAILTSTGMQSCVVGGGEDTGDGDAKLSSSQLASSSSQLTQLSSSNKVSSSSTQVLMSSSQNGVSSQSISSIGGPSATVECPTKQVYSGTMGNGESMDVKCKLKNLASTPLKNFKVVRSETTTGFKVNDPEDPNAWMVTMCLGDLCYGPMTYEWLSTESGGAEVILQPGEYLELKATISPNSKGTVKTKWIVFDENSKEIAQSEVELMAQ